MKHKGNWSRIGTNRWVCSDYLTNSKSTVSSNSNTKVNTKKYSNGSYKVNASLLNVRTGPGTNYKRLKNTTSYRKMPRKQIEH